MRSYPEQVDWFQRHLYTGMHSRKGPLALDELHDFFEVRNVIVHSSGHAKKQYIDRTKHMTTRRLPREYASPRIDFVQLTDFAAKLLVQAEFVDSQVAAKWQTTRNSN
jgi:hypothetical protein